MKKTLLLAVITSLLCAACDDSKDEVGEQKLASYSKDAFILQTRSIPTQNGTLAVNCYLDEQANSICAGAYEDGKTATDEQVQKAMSELYIDPRIHDAIKANCENKTLLLVIDPKVDMPDIDTSNFCYALDGNKTTCDGKSEAEVKENNEKIIKQIQADIQKAKANAANKLVQANPGLINEQSLNQYIESYSAIDIKLNACDFDLFIQQNSDKLNIVEFRDVVEQAAPVECQSRIEHKVLLTASLFDVVEQSGADKFPKDGSYQIFSNQDDMMAYISSTGSELTSKISNKLDNIDFEQNVVLAIFSAITNPQAKLTVDQICAGESVNAYLESCAGQPVDDADAVAALFIQAPKAEYQVKFSQRRLVCE